MGVSGGRRAKSGAAGGGRSMEQRTCRAEQGRRAGGAAGNGGQRLHVRWRSRGEPFFWLRLRRWAPESAFPGASPVEPVAYTPFGRASRGAGFGAGFEAVPKGLEVRGGQVSFACGVLS
jgi:hypothetical protein